MPATAIRLGQSHRTTLQHLATPCNTLRCLQKPFASLATLQHTATHVDILQDAATNCNKLRCLARAIRQIKSSPDSHALWLHRRPKRHLIMQCNDCVHISSSIYTTLIHALLCARRRRSLIMVLWLRLASFVT